MDWKALLASITGSVDQELRFGERSLRHVLTEYVTHFHHERPHQGKGNVVLMPVSCSKPRLGRPGPIQCHERLGRLLMFYDREAA